MDTYLAIASKRDWRSFSDRPIPEEIANRILDAGRLAGSAANKQHWRFIVVGDPELKKRLAERVYAASNILNAGLVVAVVGPEGTLPSFDAGRAAQNMFLAAWNEGIVSVPNGMPDAGKTAALLGIREDERPLVILSFAYPSRDLDPEGRPAEEWSAEADRKPLAEVVERR
jgi:nitroreductase